MLFSKKTMDGAPTLVGGSLMGRIYMPCSPKDVNRKTLCFFLCTFGVVFVLGWYCQNVYASPPQIIHPEGPILLGCSLL